MPLGDPVWSQGYFQGYLKHLDGRSEYLDGTDVLGDRRIYLPFDANET